MSRPDHARAIRERLTDPHKLCSDLGLLEGHKKQAGGVIVRCPAHKEKTASCSVHVGRDRTIAVRCHACGFTGDALTLIAAVRELDVHDRDDFRKVLEEGAELAGYDLRSAESPRAPRAARPPPAPPPPPSYPPTDEVAGLWERARPLSTDPDAVSYLTGRALDVAALERLDLARVLPPDAPAPPWAALGGRSWPAAGYRLLLPVYDATGALRSLRAWRLDGQDPKRVAPAGFSTVGLVLANAAGRELLATGQADVDLVVVEGEPDFLTWSLAGEGRAALGILAHTWTPGLAARVPQGARVAIRVHRDGAGDKYAAALKTSLAGRGELHDFPRPSEGKHMDENEKHQARELPVDPFDGMRRLEVEAEPLPDEEPSETGPTSAERRAAPRRDGGDRRAVRLLDPWVFRTTDTGNSERLVARHGADLRYCDPWKKWLVWTGQRWTVDEKGAVRRRAKETARSIYAEASAVKSRKPGNEEQDKRAEERRKALAAWAVKTEARDRREAMMFLAQSEEPLPVIAAELDTDPWLFNVQNGTLNLRNGELGPHRREDLMTKLAPVAYDPAAKCPTWLAFLTEIMGGSAELVTFLQKLAGYALTGVVREHVLVSLFGNGSNGKSTFLETLLVMMGDYGWQAPPDLLLAKTNDPHPTDKAQLFGVRLAVCMETPSGRRLDEALMKALTGGDTITARRMREDSWSFSPSHKLVVGTNHKPAVSTTDHGTWRRQRLVPFLVTIPDEKQDRKLPEKLRAELPGILRWAVEGCLAWQKDGLGNPATVRDATNRWRDESDPLGPFLTECCEIGRGLEAKTTELLRAYTEHCQASGEEPLKPRTFGTRLTERGLIAGKSNSVRLWKGIRLLTPFERRERATGTEGTQGTDKSGFNSKTESLRVENHQVTVPSVPSVPAETIGGLGGESEGRDWFDA